MPLETLHPSTVTTVSRAHAHTHTQLCYSIQGPVSASPPIGCLYACVRLCVHACIHIYYSSAWEHMSEVSLVGEIRGFFISVLSLVREWMCASVCVSNRLSNRPFVEKGGVETYRVTKKKGKKEGFLGRGKTRGGRKRGITVWTRKSAARKAMKVEVRLRDGKEGAQQGLSLSYFHFTVQPWIYQERFAEFRHTRYKKTLQICLPIQACRTQHSSTPSVLTSQYCQHSQPALFHLRCRLPS